MFATLFSHYLKVEREDVKKAWGRLQAKNGFAAKDRIYKELSLIRELDRACRFRTIYIQIGISILLAITLWVFSSQYINLGSVFVFGSLWLVCVFISLLNALHTFSNTETGLTNGVTMLLIGAIWFAVIVNYAPSAIISGLLSLWLRNWLNNGAVDYRSALHKELRKQAKDFLNYVA